MGFSFPRANLGISRMGVWKVVPGLWIADKQPEKSGVEVVSDQTGENGVL